MNQLTLAKAINGPHLPVREGSKFTLEHLRDVRWDMLSEHEQGLRLCEAQAVLDMIAAVVEDKPARAFEMLLEEYEAMDRPDLAEELRSRKRHTNDAERAALAAITKAL